MRCVYDIKFGMLQMHKNEISLRKCSGSSAHLRTLEGTLVTRESTRFNNKDSEPKSQVSWIRLIFFPEKDYIFKDTYFQKHSVIFPMSEWEPACFAKRHLQTTKWKNTKIYCKTTGGVPSQMHSRSQGGQRGHGPPKCLENIVILCFERRVSKQNSVIRLKSNILLPPNFWAGYATGQMWPFPRVKIMLCIPCKSIHC